MAFLSTLSPDKRIDSPKNPTIKALLRLKDRRHRDREQRYLIEGNREISRAAQANIPLQELYVSPEHLSDDATKQVIHLQKTYQLGVTSVSKDAFERLSNRQTPDGMLALASMHQHELDKLELPDDALVLVLDGLEKPGNVGALLRTADAVGVSAVFLSGLGTDLFNPNVIRASMGSVFSRPVLSVPEDVLIAFLRARGFRVVATTPHTRTEYWDEAYVTATAVVLGTEHEGLTDAWLTAATHQVKVPMSGLADSLNVATTGALLLYEALRQRSKRKAVT